MVCVGDVNVTCVNRVFDNPFNYKKKFYYPRILLFSYFYALIGSHSYRKGLLRGPGVRQGVSTVPGVFAKFWIFFWIFLYFRY